MATLLHRITIDIVTVHTATKVVSDSLLPLLTPAFRFDCASFCLTLFQQQYHILSSMVSHLGNFFGSIISIRKFIITRVVSHMARSDTLNITSVVSRLARSDTHNSCDAMGAKSNRPHNPAASIHCMHNLPSPIIIILTGMTVLLTWLSTSYRKGADGL